MPNGFIFYTHRLYETICTTSAGAKKHNIPAMKISGPELFRLPSSKGTYCSNAFPNNTEKSSHQISTRLLVV
jgi:hypothetical protein